MFTHIFLDHLPQVPEHFITRCFDISKLDNLRDKAYIKAPDEYVNRRLLKNGKEYGSRRGNAIEMGKDWEKWVDENIITNWIETGVRISKDNGSPLHGPHTDKPIEKYKFFYLVEPGGDSVYTSWYQEKGKPLMRPHSISVCDYSLVEKVEEIVIPKNKWMLFNTNIMHGVENLKGDRITLIVSISVDHPYLHKWQ